MSKNKADEIRTRYFNLGREAIKPWMTQEERKAIMARYRKLGEEFIRSAS